MSLVRRHHELLNKGAWFGGLPPRLQDLILERAIERRYRKGDAIFREGGPGVGLGVVLEGRVKTMARHGAQRELLLYVGESGYWFGALDVLSGSAPRLDSIVADTRVVVLHLSNAAFNTIVEEEPRYYPHFAKLLIARYCLLHKFLTESHGLPAEEWFRARLASVAGGRRGDAGTTGPVDIVASQADLAAMAGVSRQTAGILLARLEELGAIEIGFKRVRVFD